MLAFTKIYAKITERREGSQPIAASTETAVACRVPLRPFANEDVFFYKKRIDNSGVVRQSDPKQNDSAWRLVAGMSTAAIVFIGILIPGAYDLAAGYELQKLRKQASDLNSEQARLELQAAGLLTPERIEALAREQQFTDPPAESLVFLNTKDTSAVAQNQPAVALPTKQ